MNEEKHIKYIDVALNLNLSNTLEYEVPPNLVEYVKPGARVIVTIGKKKGGGPIEKAVNIQF